MAIGASKRRIQKSSGSQELNLIPMMNLFIIIIPLLLMITVTVHLAFLSLNLTASGTAGVGEGEGEGATERVKEIKIVLYVDRFEIQEEGVRESIIIPALETEAGSLRHDYQALDDLMVEMKERNRDINEIRITPYPDVYYGTLLRAIDICKRQGFPEVKYERLRIGAI